MIKTFLFVITIVMIFLVGAFMSGCMVYGIYNLALVPAADYLLRINIISDAVNTLTNLSWGAKFIIGLVVGIFIFSERIFQRKK